VSGQALNANWRYTRILPNPTLVPLPWASMNKAAQESFEALVDALGLSIGLRMVSSAHM
jgi:hypothetical protein